VRRQDTPRPRLSRTRRCGRCVPFLRLTLYSKPWVWPCPGHHTTPVESSRACRTAGALPRGISTAILDQATRFITQKPFFRQLTEQGRRLPPHIVKAKPKGTLHRQIGEQVPLLPQDPLTAMVSEPQAMDGHHLDTQGQNRLLTSSTGLARQ